MKKLGALLVSILVVLSTILPAHAALKFDYQSTSNTQATYASAWRDFLHNDSSILPILTTGPTGTFGTTYLDQTVGNQSMWIGLDNCPIGQSAFTVLMRLIPIVTGSPSANRGLLSMGGYNDYNNYMFGGFSMHVTTGGLIYVMMGTQNSGNNIINAAFATGPTFTANTPMDLWITWDGTTTANAFKLWTAQNGNTASNISSMTAGVAQTVGGMVRGNVPQITNNDLPYVAQNAGYHINEIAIWDDVEVPSSYGARTGFVTSTVYEGYNQTSLSAGSVANGTSYGPGPGSLTGTNVTPTASQVASGVTFGPASGITGTNVGSGFNTDPGIANVANGTTYTILNVGKTGSRGATTDPGVANVVYGTTYSISGASKTGTYVEPTTGQVESGVAYGPLSAYLGTNVGAGFNTDPGIANVLLSTSYEILGVSNTGIRDDAIPANVLTGIVYGDGSKTGTLQFNINFPKVILGL
jgi:hypothetical protein